MEEQAQAHISAVIKVRKQDVAFYFFWQLKWFFIHSSFFKGNVQKYTILDEVVISQLADDTIIFLRGLEQIPNILELLNRFSKASGLTLNLFNNWIINNTNYYR